MRHIGRLGFAVLAGCPILLVACGGPPLTAGTYEVETDRVVENSCPLSDEDFGVGEVELLTLSWPDDSTIRLAGGEGRRDYSFDGNSDFESEDTIRDPLEDGDPCFFVSDLELYGEILSETRFEIESEFTLSVDGDCSNWDTTGFPCGGSLWAKGKLRE